MIIPKQFLSRSLALAVAIPLLSIGAARVGTSQGEKLPNEGKGAITGTMDIDFQTRTRVDAKGNPEKGVKDRYKLAFTVVGTTEFAGQVSRVPQLKSEGGILSGEKEVQGNQMEYDVSLTVINPNDPTQKKTVGKWVGSVPINDRGEYSLGGTTASPHRVAVDAMGKAAAFTENFGGKLIGKQKEGKKAGKALSFVRKVAGKDVKYEVKNSDPMRFEGVNLAPGPALIYPKTMVNGSLDFDYDTSNWLTSGLVFKYNLNGKDVEDIVTGSIKWVEDPNRDTNGKGYYEFNLRFNEAKNAAPTSEADAFKGMSDEEAFFAVDNSIPSLTGRVEYVDTMAGDKVISSKVVYKLDANKLTKPQVMNFFKLWLLGTGPLNDE